MLLKGGFYGRIKVDITFKSPDLSFFAHLARVAPLRRVARVSDPAELVLAEQGDGGLEGSIDRMRRRLNEDCHNSFRVSSKCQFHDLQ